MFLILKIEFAFSINFFLPTINNYFLIDGKELIFCNMPFSFVMSNGFYMYFPAFYYVWFFNKLFFFYIKNCVVKYINLDRFHGNGIFSWILKNLIWSGINFFLYIYIYLYFFYIKFMVGIFYYLFILL